MFTGQIGVVPHAHTPAEWLIEAVTRSTVHHAIIAISETECVSCEPGGALVRPISRFPDAYWSHFDLTSKQRKNIVFWAKFNIGAKYGWFADLAIGVALIWKLRTPKWVARWLDNGRRFECAQYCDAAYAYGGVHLFKGVVPSAVYPGMFIPIWEEHGWPVQ